MYIYIHIYIYVCIHVENESAMPVTSPPGCVGNMVIITIIENHNGTVWWEWDIIMV